MCDDTGSISIDPCSTCTWACDDVGAPHLLGIPAQAEVHLALDSHSKGNPKWLPAFAGMTSTGMVERQPCVHILASSERGTLYVGVRSDLLKRIWQYKNNLVDGFTRKYRIHNLVWYERHGAMETAILRERAIKEWKRASQVELIETSNPRCVIFIQASAENGFRLAPE